MFLTAAVILLFMCALKLISDSVPHVADKIFARKFVALGRIITHWSEIMGEDLARKAQPLKIVHTPANRANKPKVPKTKKPLSVEQKNTLTSMLDMVEDSEIKERLERFGKAFLQDKNNK